MYLTLSRHRLKPLDFTVYTNDTGLDKFIGFTTAANTSIGQEFV